LSRGTSPPGEDTSCGGRHSLEGTGEEGPKGIPRTSEEREVVETFQVVFRGRNYTRVAISVEYGPYALMDVFLSLADCFKECGDMGRWGPELFEGTTKYLKSPVKIYRLEE